MAKKIMVVDDDAVIVKYITALMQDNGYVTCSASNGTEALEVIKRERPDLITLDLEMEEGWGPKFYRRLSKEEDLKDTPVIVISGLSGRDYSIKKAVAYLAKPFEPNELLDLVKKTIGT